MASVAHFAVGLSAAKAYQGPTESMGERVRVGLWMCMLSMLPDADIIAFHLGIPYSHPYGHRGAWHSPVMAVLAAALLAPYLAKLFDQPRVRTFVVATLVIASHGLLDTLTDGGEGIALLWPFSDERYFAPFRPIPVSPLGMAFLSERGLMVAMTELIYCLPLWAYLGWPNKRQ